MTITVTQLNNYLKAMIDMDSVLAHVEVKGEVTNVRPSGQYLYFSLKDENSQIDCFAYSNEVEVPQAGIIALASGAINFLQKSGRMSFFVRKLQDTAKQGDGYLQFIALRDKLSKEGLFDQNRKKAIPSYCEKIGVVSSRTGAVIKDIEDVVRRRQPSADIVLYPVRVQGLFAVKQIVEGLQYFNSSDVDVVIVARGGGSDEDLAIFNDEAVVRAVANCTKPTVSAIGHGIDFTLTDYAADRRAVTPTEAGEFVTILSSRIEENIVETIQRSRNSILRRTDYYSASVGNTLSKINSNFVTRLRKTEFAVMEKTIMQSVAIERKYDQYSTRLKLLTERISANNPMNKLLGGYAIVNVGNNRVKSVRQLKIGDSVTLTLYDGTVNATVESITEKQYEIGRKS